MIYVSHLLEDIDMRQLSEETDMGIESIEFSISENLDRLAPKLKAYEKRLEEMKCRDLTLHGPFLDLNPMTFDSLVLEVTMKRYEAAYEAAKYLGARKIVFHTCYVPDVYMLVGWADRVSDFWKCFLEGKEGIGIVFENVFDREPEPVLEVADKVKHPDFSLCLDMGHAHCFSKVPVMEWVEMFGSRIGHLHAHDNMGNRDSHAALGDGNIPVDEVLKTVRRNNPDVTFTVECSSKADVLKSYGAIKRILGLNGSKD